MMTVSAITELLLKHLQHTLSDSEQQVLEEWLAGSAQRRHFFDQLNDEEQLREQVLLFEPAVQQQNEAAILAKIHQLRSGKTAVRKLPFLQRRWLRYAAAILIVLSAVAYLLLSDRDERTTGKNTAVATKMDIAPGRNGAILTLDDGSQIVLDSAANGLVATQSSTAIILENGKLLYDLSEGNTGKVLYNTMTTPKGRQFQVVLPDGTKVWLNAASSIRYPVVFTGQERKVYVAGEAYFEVMRDVTRPFLVNVDNRAEIEVLGTQFNVNAYDNEKTLSTTLVKGSVRFAAQQGTVPGAPLQEVVLKPGQQALINQGTGARRSTTEKNTITVLDHADLGKITAWKNGLFNFEDEAIENVMKQLERWYDIEVVYENGIPNLTFWGEMSRQVQLTDLLEILQRTEVAFRLEEGRRLVVMNK